MLMKKLIFCAVIAASFVLGACATVESSSESSAKNAAKEEFVTGSRLKRSESLENYQGTRSTTAQDYQQYKAPSGVKGE